MTATSSMPLLSAPTSDASCVYEELAYVESHDAVINCTYAFVAYKETDRSSGAWRVRIRSSQTAGAVFEPEMIVNKSRATSGAHFLWGYNFEPTSGDPRMIEFRVHVSDARPSEIEIAVRLRNADHSAGEVRSVRFAWPG